MPGLRALGSAHTDGPTIQGLPPYDLCARQLRSGRPTDKQEEAIRVALNTPGVVIIGPPGTGKTQVMAALERRLSELNESINCTRRPHFWLSALMP